jgi:5'-nucleotidase
MSLKGKRILVTNDDGINAPGIEVLEAIARELSDDVWIVAPETEQSGASHSLTLHLPVRLRQIDERRFATSGTPTDCVLLALREAINVDEKPVDLILSGVNRGSNAADDITYSGTVAAAMEGTVLGVPSIALSQLIEDGSTIHWETARAHAPALIEKIVEQGWPQGSLININFPNVPKEAINGTRFCPQGKRRVSVGLAGRKDLRDRPYYWIGGERDNTAEKAGTDVDLLHKGYVTITSLSMDMTDYQTLENLRSALASD